MAKTTIEWCENSWSPITGCTQVSEECENCYARRIALRLQREGNKYYRNGFDVTCHEARLEEPYHKRKPRRFFVCSMSDIFHNDVPAEFIQRIWKVMNDNSQHTYYILTKRPERMVKAVPHLNWTPNIWAGVTVGVKNSYWRLDELRKMPTEIIKFISVEPLLESVADIPLEGISWVIVGAESGQNCRPMKPEWVRELRDKCIEEDRAFFFKGWGGRNKKESGRTLDDRTWDEYPVVPSGEENLND